MAVNKLKKINVRSPYYITVSKAIEADVDPTEPVEQESTITCGSTTQVGVDVGTRTFKISTAGRQLGNYAITFSGIKTPIKYRIGHSANMPAYTTAGLDSYASEWNTATGESPTLSDFGANPNGVSATATYTSIQGDIDLYGEEIQLEIQQPIITEDYSFSLSCPDFAADETPESAGKVVIISLINYEVNAVGHDWNNIRINGQLLTGFNGVYKNTTQRWVLSGASPAIEPEDDNTYNVSSPSESRVTGYGFFNRALFSSDGLHNFRHILNNPSPRQGRIKAKNVNNPLSSSINEISITNDTSYIRNKYFSTAKLGLMITRHDVELKNGVYYIRGSADGFDSEKLGVTFTLYGGEEFYMSFEGSNEVELEPRFAAIDRLSQDGSEFEDTEIIRVVKSGIPRS